MSKSSKSVKPVSKAIVIDTPSGIEGYRLCALKAALKLEMIGLRHSRGPVAPIIRDLLGVKTRDKGKLLQELVDYIDDFNTQFFNEPDDKAINLDGAHEA